MKSVPVTELEVYEKLFNIIEQFAQHQNLSFYLTRLHDELYRKMHPQTTKPYPPEVAYYWESIRFHSSERVLQLLKGNNNNSNIHVPHPDSLKNWAGPPIYGHLYTDETIKKLVTTTLEQHGSCIALISWDIVTVRPCLSYGQNGYAFGLDSGPVTHTQFLQENYSSDNFAKKAIVFQIIDLYGNFSNVCAVFALPNSNMFSFIMDKVREIDQKWSVHEKFCIIGSVTDGEFEPATVENFLNNNNERKQWTHCEDYIHILKRLRNPLIDSSHAISMMGLIYLTSKYDNLNRKLRRSDLIVKDEMNVESCLNLIKEDVLQALQTIRSNLKEEFHDILPSVPNFFNNFVLSDSKNIHKSGITDFIMKDIDIANLNKMTEKQLNEYFKKNYNIPTLTIQEEYAIVDSMYYYLWHTRKFYYACHDEKLSLEAKLNDLYDCIQYFKTKLDIISDQTLRGIV